MIPQGYKQTEVGIIPREWAVTTLGAICNNIYSGKNKAKSGCGNYPVYGSTGVIGYANEFVYSKSVILVARVGANAGTINKVEGYFDVSDNALIIDSKQETDLNFLYELLKFANLNKLIFGSGQPLITAGLLKSMYIAVPLIEEQRKIAEVLGEWDKAIELQTKIIDKLELRKRALMQRLLSGRQRLPGFSTPWQKVRLGKLFEERVETKCDYLPLLSITADKGVILQTDSDKKDTSNDDKSKYKRICINDIGYNTMRMWQGRSALSEIEGIVSPAYTIVIPAKTVNSMFMIALIQQPRTVYDFWTHSQGLVDDTLNCKFPNFAQVKVYVPSLSEQTAIAKVLSIADKEIEIAKTKLASLRTQKRGLMQQLLTGKKRVKY